MRLGMCTLLTQTFCLVCNMQELGLHYNQIGDKGLEAFSAALAGGALARCTSIKLGGNPASAETGSGVSREFVW